VDPATAPAVGWSHGGGYANVGQHAVEGLLGARRQPSNSVPVAHVHLGSAVPADDHGAEAKLLVPKHLPDAECDACAVGIGHAARDHVFAILVELAEDAHASEGVVDPTIRLLVARRTVLSPRGMKELHEARVVATGLELTCQRSDAVGKAIEREAEASMTHSR
jgi:hypothetical protein